MNGKATNHAKMLARPVATPPRPMVQRECTRGSLAYSDSECVQCKERRPLQRRAEGLGRTWAQPVVQRVLRSSGLPLHPVLRASMEPRSGHDFSAVRVHTDARVAALARRVGARAFTIGRDIVFGEGQYAPGTPSGHWLIAHEFAHVVQQQGSSGTLQAAAVDPHDSMAEREARGVADAVANGCVPPRITVRSIQPTINRSVLGDIVGGVVGAAGGAALGFLAGGPVGAVVGGLFGGVAGLAIGDAVSADKRPLSGPEGQEAKIVFGTSLNAKPVRLAEAPIMAIGSFARTPFETVYFPPGTFKLGVADLMPWLIHELAHVWQYQHGVSVLEKAFWALHGASAYNYGDDAGLRAATTQGKRFLDFNTEQQADICRNYYERTKGGGDTSAFDPFITEVRAGGRSSGPATRASVEVPS